MGRSALRSILWLIAGANALVILWLWVRGGNVAGVHSVPLLLDSIGRITGLLGAYFLLIQILLLARLPFVERLVGFDRLTVWHRLNGKVCLYLILAHVAFITAGYALQDRISIPREYWTFLTQYPGMVTATAGTVLLILTAVTSFVIVRRRMRYEMWYVVHLTAYVGILLSWFHEVPTGNEFVLNAASTAYWTGLYVATLGLMVVFRVARPIARSLHYRMRVAEVTPETPGVVSLRITGRHLDRLDARAGQFFLWRFLSANGRWWEAHPFSLSEAPDGKSLRITVKGMGDFSRHIGNVKPGTYVLAEGPFGVFTDELRRRHGVVLIAGGIGITPIRALVEHMTGDVVLLYRAVKPSDLVFHHELEGLAGERGFAMHYILGDHRDPGGADLMSPDHLHQLVPDIVHRDVYVCGPPAMTDFIERNLRRANVPGHQIHAERFAL